MTNEELEQIRELCIKLTAAEIIIEVSDAMLHDRGLISKEGVLMRHYKETAYDLAKKCPPGQAPVLRSKESTKND